jgi:hypothetical protein
MSSPFSHQELRKFLTEAKHRTYASQGDDATVAPLLPGTRQLEYAAGPWLYRDIYAGMAYFVGQELVYYQQQPVWSMVYSGGIVDIPDPTVAPHTIYPFLKAALRLVSIELPYRGPEHYAEHGYQYTNRIEGLLQEFRGNETITTAEIIVYRLRYNGGILH